MGMVSRPEARLNLSKLLAGGPDLDPEVRGEGALLPEEEALRASGLRLDAPLAWSVTVRSTGGEEDFVVEGSVEGSAVMECRRCLIDVPTPARATFLYPMAYRPDGDAGLDLIEDAGGGGDRLSFGDPDVDFAALLTQLFAIELPLAPLCREACRGLATDGVNLNDHPDHVPAGPRPEETSPFAALKDLDLDSDSRT